LLSAALAAFALTPAAGAAARGTYIDLHDFNGGAGDGFEPNANVTLDDFGNIYGTAQSGDINVYGVVFKLAPDGTQTILHAFAGGSEGWAPGGGMVLMDGALYGTALGGASGNGVLFKLSKNGNYKTLHDFSGADGIFPKAI
jgi:uncharacterized repeat protein (TIGR03803 family)